MASNFSIDRDILNTTLQMYQDKYTELDTIFTNLKTGIETLRTSEWVSDASTTYFSRYDDKWVSMMEFQLEILDEMINVLQDAVNTYERIDGEAATITV